MKKFYSLCMLLLAALAGTAQLTGTKNIPGDYADLATAISTLNTQGVGVGGVVLNVTANQATTTGYVITASGSATNPIVLQGNGMTVSMTGGAATTSDAIIALAGSDYVTINNFLLSGDANTEWGILLAKKNGSAPFDGCQNNLISNNAITLNKTNSGSIGIYAAHILAGTTSTLSSTGIAGSDANSNNTVTNNTIGNVYVGIYFNGATAAAGYDSGNSVYANGLSDFGGNAAGVNVYGIRSGNFSSVLIRKNNVQGGSTVAVTAYGIQIGATTGTATIDSNTVRMTSAGTTSALNGIGSTGSAGTITISSNNVSNNSYSSATAAGFNGIISTNTTSPGPTFVISNNIVSDNLLSGTGTLQGIDAGVATSVIISNNTISGNSKTGASGSLFCIRTAPTAATSIVNISFNTINNNGILNATSGSSLVYGIVTQGAAVSILETYSNNTISNLSIAGSATTSSNNLYGIFPNFQQMGNRVISGNTIGGLTNALSGNVYGIDQVQSFDIVNSATALISGNKVYDLNGNASGSAVSGIYVGSGQTITVQNNLVGDLKAPTVFANNPLNGINVQGGSTVNVYYNTVRLNATSTGTSFGSSAFYAATSTTLKLFNNILINTSTSNGSGVTAAYRRSGTSLTSYTGNNNILYAGTPGAFNLIYFDGTTSGASSNIQTLAAYQALVAPQDNASRTENTPFISTTGTSVGFLHISPSATTLAADNGQPVATVTNDYDLENRSASTPDIGADEFTNVSTCADPGTPSASNLTTAGATITFTPGTGAASFQYEVRSGGTCGTGSPLQSGTNTSGTITLAGLSGSTTYTICVRRDCGSGSFSNWVSATFTTTACPTIQTQPQAQAVCPSSPVSFTVALSATPAGTTYQWNFAGNPIGTATNASYTINSVGAANAGNYSVTVTVPGCANLTSNNAALTVNAVTAITTQPQSQSVCPGSSVTLTVAATGSNLSYQWRKGGNPIAAATGASYTINPVTAADAGNYDVLVTGACGTPQTSSVAQLAVGSFNYWVGTVSTDWNTAGNWCGGIPTSSSTVSIPAGTTFSPSVTASSEVGALTIAPGATLTISASGTLSVYGNLTNNGTLSAAQGTLAFRGAAAQTVSGLTAANVIQNGAGGTVLNGRWTVTGALTLTQGNVLLNGFSLTLGSGSTGSAASHIVSSGLDSVVASNVGAAAFTVPVAPNATSYNPVTISNGGNRDFSVRIAAGVNPSSVAWIGNTVNRTWYITALSASASPATIALGYADADINAQANGSGNMEVGVYTGSSWTVVTPAGGVAPAGTSTLRTVTSTTSTYGPTVVGYVGSIVLLTATSNLEAGISDISLLPNAIRHNTVLQVKTTRDLQLEWTLVDAQGRVLRRFAQRAAVGTNRLDLDFTGIAPGAYQLLGRTAKGNVSVLRLVRL